MIAKDPVQETLKAYKEVLNNLTYNGGLVPVTVTFNHTDTVYIVLSIPEFDNAGTDDTVIYSLTLRIEVVTEYLAKEERETVANGIMGQITPLIHDLSGVNALLTNFNVDLIYPQNGSRDVDQDNISSLIIKRKDFTLFLEQL